MLKTTSAKASNSGSPSSGNGSKPVARVGHVWPASEVKAVAIGKLKPHPKNPTVHSPEQVEQIKRSMLERGWTIPILADEDGTILAGHGRIQAAEQLIAAGHKEFARVPTMRAVGWSEADKLAYLSADNQLTKTADWNPKLLKLNMGELKRMNYDMRLTAFGELELRKFTARPLGNPNAVPPVAAVAISRPGDIWRLGKHRLICGDATDEDNVTALFAGAPPVLMVTDPPYGVDYDPAWRSQTGLAPTTAKGRATNDHRADWFAAWAHFPGAVVYVWHGALHASEVEASLSSHGLKVRSQIVWVKTRPVISRGNYHWQHEPCFYATREGERDRWQHDHELATYAVRKGEKANWEGGRKQSTVWFIEHAANDTGHGTQKPVECMKRPIENNSKLGDRIYDPFCGSGTTIIAAEMTGRLALAVELEPRYVDVAVRRWQRFTSKKATLESSGQAFEVVEKERGARSAPSRATQMAAG